MTTTKQDSLERQQAPIGDTLDEDSKFIDLMTAWANEGPGEDALAAFDAIVAYITAWKDAQLARERHGQPAKVRCEVVERFADYSKIAHLIGSIFFAGDFKAETANERELEELLKKTGHRYESWDEVSLFRPDDLPVEFLTTPVAQAQGEPVAWMVGLDVFKFKAHAERNVRNPDLKPIPLGVLGPAPQADEVRVRELEAALKQKNDSAHREREKLMGHITKLETALWKFGKEGEAALAAIRSAPTHSPQADEGNVK